MADLGHLPQIPLDVSFEIISESLSGIQTLVIDPGVKSFEQDLIGAFRSIEGQHFFYGKRQELDDGRSPGERLADGLADLKLLAARQNEQAVFSLFIHENLDVGDEFRGSLDLIEDGPIGKLAEKSSGIGPCEFPDLKAFQVGVRFPGEDLPAQGGFTRLSRAGDCHHRILGKNCFQVRAGCPRDHWELPGRKILDRSFEKNHSLYYEY